MRNGSARRIDAAELWLPLGVRNSSTTFVADYEDVDLYQFTRQFGWTALEPQGRMRGKLAMNWLNGRPFDQVMQGTGVTVIVPPAGESVATSTLAPDAPPNPSEPRQGFVKFKPFGPFPLAADTKYRFTASTLDFEPGWAATPKTYVTFSGHARGGPVNVPFHVTSHDWQASDRMFTAIMTNFGSQVGAIPVGGRGTFDGLMTKAFNASRPKASSRRSDTRDVDWASRAGRSRSRTATCTSSKAQSRTQWRPRGDVGQIRAWLSTGGRR
jgi:hypothetical protein